MIKQFYFKQFTLACHLFALILNVRQFYWIHRKDPFRCYRSRPEWTWEWWQRRGTSHSPKFQHYSSFAIRLFCVIFKTLAVGVLLLCRVEDCVFCSPSRLGHRTLVGGVLPFCRDAVGVFYNPSQVGYENETFNLLTQVNSNKQWVETIIKDQTKCVCIEKQTCFPY